MSELRTLNIDKKQAEKKDSRLFRPSVIVLIIAGTLLNLILSWLMRQTDLPFYVDTVGTILTTALGGIIPGIITALITNIVNFAMDGESIFYASLNMLIAIVTAGFFESKRKKHLLHHVLYVLAIAFIGGVIGGFITWFLYGEPSSSPLSDAIMDFYTNSFKFNTFWSFMFSVYLTDIIDKAISYIAAVWIMYLLPEKLKKSLFMSGWRQKKLSKEDQRAVKKNLKGKLSIGTRTIVLVIASTFLMTVIVTVFSLINYRRYTKEWIAQNAEQVAYLAAGQIDADKVEDYLRYGYDTAGYTRTHEKIQNIMDSSANIQFLYVYKFEQDGCHVVFDSDARLPDGTMIEGDEPGAVVPYEPELEPYIQQLIRGERIPAIETHDQYGSLLSVYYPIYNSNGRCVCYAITNVNIQTISSFSFDFVGRVVLLFLGFFILAVVIGLWISRYRIVMPLAGMTKYADEVAFMDEDEYENKLKKMESLDIHTGDEMQLLYKALCKMTGDTVSQMNDIRMKSEEIAKMQNGLIITMADMVESRDSDTGAHIQKTAAYVRIILQGLKKNGYYTEKLTDKYMQDVEMSAPLHDIGKINISDTVLNKPGKLTDEEYAIMKTHTTAGKNILESAISTVEGDNYLKEARNMAGYHHERWDGKGYPEGLHGEVIPLSARVMAVADVFDALVSPRIYKPPFPLEKALQIIQEGSGTQFDPKVVEVFMEALPEVKNVMNKYRES